MGSPDGTTLMAPTWQKLRSMTDDEVIAAYDSAATNTVVGTGYFLEEMARRRSDRQATTMLRLTWVIVVLTLANVVATAVAVWIAAD